VCQVGADPPQPVGIIPARRWTGEHSALIAQGNPAAVATGRVDSPVVEDESQRRPVVALILLSGGMAVAGVALTIGALEGEALFGRDRPSAWVFAAVTVAISAVAGGWGASAVITRLTARQRSDNASADHASAHVDPAARSGVTSSSGGICL
jgi:hypothetical protein